MKKIGFCAMILLVLTVTASAVPLSVDILSMYYSDDTGRTIAYDFTDGYSDTPNRIEIPAAAVSGYAPGETPASTTFLWESTIHDVASLDLFTDPGFSRLSVPNWHFNGDPDDDYIGDFASLGAYNAEQTASLNWTYRIRVTNFQNPDIADTAAFRYRYCAAGMGSWDAQSECFLHAEWFTGWNEGDYYDNVLVLRAEVDDDVNNEQWESEPIIIENLDPVTDELEFKLQIQNGTTFNGYYRINEGNWQPICENYQTPYPIPGFPTMFPTLELENGVQNPMLYRFTLEQLGRIGRWWQDGPCNYDNYVCEGADMNWDGTVNWDDLVIFAEYWCTVL